MSGDIVQFVRARIEEDRQHAYQLLSFGLSGERQEVIRGLAERVNVDANRKLAILALHPEAPVCPTCLSDRDGVDLVGDPWPCLTVRQVVAAYDDHAEYHQEWRP